MCTNICPASTATPPFRAFWSPKEKIAEILEEVSPNHWFSGEGITKSLGKYDQRDLEGIFKDFTELSSSHFENPKINSSYIATAGAPCSGKTTHLEEQVQNAAFKGFVYIDPDRTCLNKMKSTYLSDIETGTRTSKEAYEHWREASIFSADALMALAFRRGYAIAHGTTLTAPKINLMLDAIHHVYDYSIKIHHITCDEDERIASNSRRNSESTYQCTEKDFRDKRVMFFERLGDYLRGANDIHFFYRDHLGIVKAAEKKDTEIRILNVDLYKKIERAHDETLSHRTGYWQNSIADAANGSNG